MAWGVPAYSNSVQIEPIAARAGTLASESEVRRKQEALSRRSQVEVNDDADLIEALYRRHHDQAWRTAFAITRNREDASDAVAEAFAEVLKVLHTRGRGSVESFRPYILAATRNAAVDIVRRAGRVTPTGEDPAPERHETLLGPSDRVIAGADRSMVAEAFSDLPPRWRAVLWLTEVEDYSPRDAAVLLHASPNNVAQLGVRARGRLRERYVQLHVRNHATGECLEATERFGGLVAGELTATRPGGYAAT